MKEAGGEGFTCTAVREREGVTRYYQFKCLKGAQSAVLIAGWGRSHEVDRDIESAIKSVRFTGQTLLMPAQLGSRENRTHCRIFNEIGLNLIEDGQAAAAVSYLEFAYMFDPDPVVIENEIIAYARVNKYDQALALATRAKAQHPDRPWFAAQMALNTARLGDFDRAMGLYREVLARQDFQNDLAISDCMKVYTKADRFDNARELIEIYRKHADSNTALLLHSDLYWKKGDTANALALVDARLASLGYNAELMTAKAEYSLEASKFDDVLAATEKLKSAGSGEAYVLVLEGRAQLGLHQPAKAKTCFEQAIAREPANEMAKRHLEIASAQLGQGENTSIKTPIEPVNVPAELLSASAPATSPDESAIYLQRVTAFRFRPGQEMTTTDYRLIKVLDSAGVDDFKALEWSFDPLSERMFVNKLIVRDADGKVVGTGQTSDYYVIDERQQSSINQKKSLNIPVPGLHSGCTIELVVSKQDRAPDTKMSYTAQTLAAVYPAKTSAVYLCGDLTNVAHRLVPATSGVEERAIDGGIAWIAHDPPVHRMEALAKPVIEYLPTVLISDARANWEEEGREYLKKIDDRLKPDPAIAETAKAWTAGLNSESDRIGAVLSHMQRDFTYRAIEFGRRALIPQPAGDFLRSRLGDCKDHALLLKQLLDATGVPAHLALVNAYQPLQADVPSFDQFDHMVVYVPPTSETPRPRFFDCTDKGDDLRTGVAFGLMSGKALVLDPKQPALIDLVADPARPSQMTCLRNVTMTAQGDVKVKETLRADGYEGAGLRTALKGMEPSQRAEWMQRMLGGSVHDLTVNDVHIRQLDRTDLPLEVELEYSVSGRFHSSATQLIGAIPIAWERYYMTIPRLRQRLSPFEIRYPTTFQTTTTLRLPEGFRVASAMPAQTFDDAFVGGRISGSLGSGDRELKLDSQMRFKPGEHSAREYDTMQQSVSRALSNMEANLVLETKKN